MVVVEQIKEFKRCIARSRSYSRYLQNKGFADQLTRDCLPNRKDATFASERYATMFSFSGTLSRRSYFTRILFLFLVWFVLLLAYAYLVDYGPKSISRNVYDLGGIAVTGIAGLSLVSLVVRRVRDIGANAAFAIIPLVFGPIGIGFVAMLPSKRDVVR